MYGEYIISRKGSKLFRLIHGYKIVAVIPCEKLVHGVKNQFSSASETVPMHFCGSK